MNDLVERLRRTPHLSSLEEEAADVIEQMLSALIVLLAAYESGNLGDDTAERVARDAIARATGDG